MAAMSECWNGGNDSFWSNPPLIPHEDAPELLRRMYTRQDKEACSTITPGAPGQQLEQWLQWAKLEPVIMS